MKLITLEHTQSGAKKQVKVGFSWTTFFFGWMDAAFRGDAKSAFLQWILIVPTLGISGWYYAFKYNEKYLETLQEKGYKIV